MIKRIMTKNKLKIKGKTVEDIRENSRELMMKRMIKNTATKSKLETKRKKKSLRKKREHYTTDNENNDKKDRDKTKVERK